MKLSTSAALAVSLVFLVVLLCEAGSERRRRGVIRFGRSFNTEKPKRAGTIADDNSEWEQSVQDTRNIENYR